MISKICSKKLDFFNLAKGALHSPATQPLLLLRAGVCLRGALRAVQHLVAGGEEEAGLGKGETG